MSSSASMWKLILVVALTVCVLVPAADGAPKFPRTRPARDLVYFDRDTAFINHHQLSDRKPAPAPRPFNTLHFPQQPQPTNPRGVFTAGTDDYEQIVATGVNSLEGLIQDSNFVPGLVYTGSQHPSAGYPVGPSAGPPYSTDGPIAFPQELNSVPQAGNPASRCILCGGGSCPDCYQLDHNGVCRPKYGCQG